MPGLIYFCFVTEGPYDRKDSDAGGERKLTWRIVNGVDSSIVMQSGTLKVLKPRSSGPDFECPGYYLSSPSFQLVLKLRCLISTEKAIFP